MIMKVDVGWGVTCSCEGVVILKKKERNATPLLIPSFPPLLLSTFISFPLSRHSLSLIARRNPRDTKRDKE